MTNSRDLVPTIITNKNGVVTTVYRKRDRPSVAAHDLPSTVLPDVEEFHALKKELLKLADEKQSTSHYRWRKRVITAASMTKDTAVLKRLQRHFDLEKDTFEHAQEAINIAGMDQNDEELFDRVITFTKFAECSYLVPMYIADFIPVLLQYPDQTEKVANCVNLLSTFEDIAEVEQVSAKMAEPDQPSSVIPTHLARTITPSTTPVTDRNLVAKQVFDMSHWNAYEDNDPFDEQTYTYLAQSIRDGVLPVHLAHHISSENLSQRRTVEYVAMLTSAREYMDIKFNNDRFQFVRVMKKLYSLVREDDGLDTSAPLPIDTEEGLQQCRALYRFMIATNYHSGTGIRSKGAKRPSVDPMNPALVSLLKRHSSVDEIDSLIELYNERNIIDPEVLESFLNDDIAKPVSEGWL